MKASTKYLLTALFVLLASLTAHNLALRAEYQRGTYRDPLRDYLTLKNTDFSEINLPAAGLLNVRIVAGPFAVRLNPTAKAYVQVSQQGRRLVVSASFQGQKREYLGWGETLVISCPRLTRLRTDATYTLAGRPHTDQGNTQGNVQVQGFQQDSLSLDADRATSLTLSDTRLGLLRATLGRSPGSQTSLSIGSGNHLAAATFSVQHQSRLTLEDAIPRLRTRLGDSAHVELSGPALGSLRK